MYHVSVQGIDERMINVHYYYFGCGVLVSSIWKNVGVTIKCSEIGGVMEIR